MANLSIDIGHPFGKWRPFSSPPYKDSAAPFDNAQFEQEREDLTGSLYGRARHAFRGGQAQPQAAGLSNVPGIQAATAAAAEAPVSDALLRGRRDIGNRENQARELYLRAAEARRRAALEKDEARKARLTKLAAALIGAAITLGTGGLGAPAAIALGAAGAAGANAVGQNQIKQPTQPSGGDSPAYYDYELNI